METTRYQSVRGLLPFSASGRADCALTVLEPSPQLLLPTQAIHVPIIVGWIVLFAILRLVGKATVAIFHCLGMDRDIRLWKLVKLYAFHVSWGTVVAKGEKRRADIEASMLSMLIP